MSQQPTVVVFWKLSCTVANSSFPVVSVFYSSCPAGWSVPYEFDTLYFRFILYSLLGKLSCVTYFNRLLRITMKFQSTSTAAALLLGQAFGLPLPSSNMLRREVPQEHSHDVFLSITNEALAKSNPKGITDAVFGLLGNAAAAGGAGSVTNLDCLKQETADQAFTNGKAAGDIRLMAGALVYQALERNTGKVGLASVTCTEQAVNPEIQAVKPHQDPASANAASINKAITLELAKQLKAIGADPNLALLSGTFAAGDVCFFPSWAWLEPLMVNKCTA